MSKTARHMIPSNSLVMVFHGPGWGKTSAAIGYGIRSVGRRWRTTFVQFVKGAAWNSAEAHTAEMAGIHWPTFTNDLTWAQNPQKLCAAAWDVATKALAHPQGGLVVLDEVFHAVSNQWLSLDSLVEAVENRNPKTSVILTGRHMPETVHSMADTITYFAKEKHSERTGILQSEN